MGGSGIQGVTGWSSFRSLPIPDIQVQAVLPLYQALRQYTIPVQRAVRERGGETIILIYCMYPIVYLRKYIILEIQGAVYFPLKGFSLFAYFIDLDYFEDYH